VQRDEQHLVDVDLPPEPAATRAIDRDGMVALGRRPAELAPVGALGPASCLAEELEDHVTAAVLAGDGRRPGDAPDGVVGDHLEQGARVTAAEGVEDAVNVAERAQRSSGAMVSP